MAEGAVYWITGLSGAGKTTVARLLLARLRAAGRGAVLLDGDEMRTAFGELGEGFAPADRRRLALAYGGFAALLANQGVDVVVATVSMFHAVHAANRERIARYREILLTVPEGELAARDPKGHYGAGRAMVGREIAAELPLTPDLVVENWGDVSAADAVDRIWQALALIT